MLYYTNYDPAKNQRFVLAYDESKHGPAQAFSEHTVLLFLLFMALKQRR